MNRGFNFVSKEVEEKWLGKRFAFELDSEMFFGKVNGKLNKSVFE
ncbi:TPA: hypothetical protein ACGW44_002634 [Bacillus toyonensis]